MWLSNLSAGSFMHREPRGWRYNTKDSTTSLCISRLNCRQHINGKETTPWTQCVINLNKTSDIIEWFFRHTKCCPVVSCGTNTETELVGWSALTLALSHVACFCRYLPQYYITSPYVCVDVHGWAQGGTATSAGGGSSAGWLWNRSVIMPSGADVCQGISL